MQKELLTLFSRLSFKTGGSTPVDPAHVTIFNMEIATLGYTFGADALARLREVPDAKFANVRKTILDLLSEVAGANVTHRTLFARFPHSTPDQYQHLLGKIMGYFQHEFDLAPDDATVLSCGHAIDHRLFDLSEYGACPICEQQVPELLANKPEAGNMPYDRLTPLKIIGFADDAFLAQKGSAILARNSSLSEAEKLFLWALPTRIKLDLPEVLFKETLPFAYLRFGHEAVADKLSGATDVLRILAFVSDKTADLSLAKPVKFKVPTQHVRKSLAMLEGRSNLEEDLMRHREAWKRFARHAHVGARKYRKAAPRACEAFDRLISNEAGIETFGRRIEPHIRNKRPGDLAAILAERPGEFMRKIDLMLRVAQGYHVVVVQEKLKLAVAGATTKLLIEVRKYLIHRHETVGQRVFLPKGQMNKAQIVPDKRPQIRDEYLFAAIDEIERELEARLSRLEHMGNVYLDPDLKKVMVPFNRRGDSATSVPVAKGSRFKIIDDAKVLRLFLYWKASTDIDISAMVLSENFGFVEQCSFTNLRGSGMVHSGDLRSAPHGGSEFIDIDIETVRKKARGRYIAMSVISYSGEHFDTFPCFAGFMERDALNSGQVYEPTSVRLKFDLTGATKSYMPVLFDLHEREIVFADLATGGPAYSYVQGQAEKFQALARMVVDLPNTKPTAWDVLQAHAVARGQIVKTPEEADTCFMAADLDIEAVMALTA